MNKISSNKLVSVLISVKDDEVNILKSIESILNQTYENIEILIVDDQSQDDTYKILQSIKDNRIKLFRNEKNLGLTKSLNFLINQSNGEILARHDSDDISLLDRIEKQVKILTTTEYKVCTTRAIIKNSTSVVPRLSYLFPDELIVKYKNPFIHGTLMIYKNIIEDIGLYDDKFYFAQDYKLFKDLLKKGINIHTIKEPLYILNVKDNISSIFKNEQKYFAECVRKEIIPSNQFFS